MAFVPPARHLLRAKDLAEARTTDDVHADYEMLKSRGVEFSEAPEERPYGIDSGFHDPSGNSFRLTEVREMSAV